MISEKDLADLTFNGLLSHLRQKLEGHDFISLSQLQQKALARKPKEKHRGDY